MGRQLASTVLAALLACLALAVPILRVSAAPVFEDGFESGDFTAWTGTSGTPTVTSDLPHHGTYSMVCNAQEYAYKTFAGQSVVYHRFYFRTSALPNVNGEDMQLATGYIGSDQMYQVGILYHTSPNFLRWRLRYRDGASMVNAFSAVNQDIQVDQWYCVEAYWKKGNADGALTLWVDGVEKVSVTGEDTDNYGDLTEIRQGLPYLSIGGDAIVLTTDCVVVDTSYVGPEAEGPEERSVELVETVKPAASLTAGQAQTRLFTETVTPAATVLAWQARGVTYTATFTATGTAATWHEHLHTYLEAVKPSAVRVVWQAQLQTWLVGLNPTAALTHAVEFFGEYVETFTQTTGLTETLATWTERIIMFSETVNPSVAGEYAVEAIIEAWEYTFTEALQQTATLTALFETLEEILDPALALAALAFVVAVVGVALVFLNRD